MLRDIATAMGGKGGGRPDFAQGAVAQRTNLSAAKKTAEGLLRLN
jgi:alanyl-tRNA synthetase